MTSGRETAVAALAPVLSAAGWQARATGWFTKEISPGVMAVVAVSAASKRHAAGTASVTIMVGLRHDATEQIVEEVSGPRTPRYQGRTWVAPLGYLLPDSGYLEGERAFDELNAHTEAQALALLLTEHAEPRLRQIAGDLSELTRLADDSVTNMGPSGLCRIATLVARTQSPNAASEYVSKRLTLLTERTDPAAQQEREVAPRVLAVLGLG